MTQDDAGPMVTGLTFVPDADEDDEFVIVNDYAAAGEALDLDRPSPTRPTRTRSPTGSSR